jgi:hypothetical protein
MPGTLSLFGLTHLDLELYPAALRRCLAPPGLFSCRVPPPLNVSSAPPNRFETRRRGWDRRSKKLRRNLRPRCVRVGVGCRARDGRPAWRRWRIRSHPVVKATQPSEDTSAHSFGRFLRRLIVPTHLSNIDDLPRRQLAGVSAFPSFNPDKVIASSEEHILIDRHEGHPAIFVFADKLKVVRVTSACRCLCDPSSGRDDGLIASRRYSTRGPIDRRQRSRARETKQTTLANSLFHPRTNSPSHPRTNKPAPRIASASQQTKKTMVSIGTNAPIALARRACVTRTNQTVVISYMRPCARFRPYRSSRTKKGTEHALTHSGRRGP